MNYFSFARNFKKPQAFEVFKPDKSKYAIEDDKDEKKDKTDAPVYLKNK